MTKEEIALQHGLCTCDPIYSSRGLTAPDCPWHAFEVETAMDAYGKQEAIEFAAFCLSYTSIQSGEWYLKTDGTKPLSDVKFYTTAELYDLYLTHKNKIDVKS